MFNTDNSLLLGKYIQQFLLADADLIEMVDADNVFPLLANYNVEYDELSNSLEASEVTYPFISYERISLTPIYSKMNVSGAVAEFSIMVVSDDYTNCLEITNEVRRCLELKRYSDEYINIEMIHMTGITEAYVNKAFIQEIKFEITTST